jgi:hypothetical protein
VAKQSDPNSKKLLTGRASHLVGDQKSKNVDALCAELTAT